MEHRLHVIKTAHAGSILSIIMGLVNIVASYLFIFMMDRNEDIQHNKEALRDG